MFSSLKSKLKQIKGKGKGKGQPAPPNVPSIEYVSLPQGEEPTEYARRYGIAKEEWLQGTLKSGLTPINAFQYSKSPRTLKFRHVLRHHQKALLRGFESSQLDLIGAIENKKVEPSNLTDVHPIFARERWFTDEDLEAHTAHYWLPNPEDGSWTARNDRVWEVLLPCVTLASKFVSNSHCFVWWDALMYGERKEIVQPLKPAEVKHRLRSFHERRGRLLNTDRARCQQQFEFRKLESEVKFRIGHGKTGAKTGMPGSGGWHGVTTYEPQKNRSIITIAVEDLFPLLDESLTVSQRLISQFLVADTLVHELAVSASRCVLDSLLMHC